VVYFLKRLWEDEKELTVENIVLLQSHMDGALQMFIRKNFQSKEGDEKHYVLSIDTIKGIIFDTGVDSSDKLFDSALEGLKNASFKRYVEEAIKGMTYYNGYGYSEYIPKIVSYAKGILRIHDKIFDNGLTEGRDQLRETQAMINSKDEYIPTSSRNLNTFIGGWSRGFVNTVIAKSSHGKSSWTDYNIAQNLATGLINKVYKITPEEDAATQWRRYYAMICGLSMSGMLLKSIAIEDAHIKRLEELFKDKLIIIDSIQKFSQIIDAHESIKDADMLVVDHINSIDYPGSGTWLNNMIGGIPGLINYQKKIAKRVQNTGKRMTIVNLSQVGDKEIQRSERLSKAPRFYDAYGSSMLYQASRQMLALWYPYKDQEEISYGGKIYTENDIQISVEKSSFSKIGKIMLNFKPEFNLFSDVALAKKTEKKLDTIAGAQQQLF